MAETKAASHLIPTHDLELTQMNFYRPEDNHLLVFFIVLKELSFYLSR